MGMEWREWSASISGDKFIVFFAAGRTCEFQIGNNSNVWDMVRPVQGCVVPELCRSSNGWCEFVCPLFKYGSLKDLTMPERLNPSCILNILRELSEILCLVHERGVVHGNLSLKDVLLAPTETPGRLRVFVANFFSAAPLNCKGGEGDPKSDVCAVGKIGRQLLKHVSCSRGESIDTDIDTDALKDLLDMCVSEDPSDRPDMASLKAELDKLNVSGGGLINPRWIEKNGDEKKLWPYHSLMWQYLNNYEALLEAMKREFQLSCEVARRWLKIIKRIPWTGLEQLATMARSVLQKNEVLLRKLLRTTTLAGIYSCCND